MSDLIERLRDYIDLINGENGIKPMGLLKHLTQAADELTTLKSQLDTAMKLLRDNQSPMHFDREMTQADHDILRETRKWR